MKKVSTSYAKKMAKPAPKGKVRVAYSKPPIKQKKS
jgi:hypothetical protein